MDFDVVPVSLYRCAHLTLEYEDIVWGEQIGAGSFGSVHKGESRRKGVEPFANPKPGQYLGVDIAIKAIHSSTEYDVSRAQRGVRGSRKGLQVFRERVEDHARVPSPKHCSLLGPEQGTDRRWPNLVSLLILIVDTHSTQAALSPSLFLVAT